jgi:hypothetical protein
MRYSLRERGRLGNEWHKMQSFSVLWSALYYLGRPWGSESDPIGRWRSRLVEAFVAGKVPSSQPDWAGLGGRARRLRERQSRHEETVRTSEFANQRFLPVLATDPGLSLPVLEAAFGWLGGLGGARDATERQEWIELHRRLLSVDLKIPQGGGAEVHPEDIGGWPEAPFDHYERWLWPLLARLITELPTSDERKAIWEPLVTAGEERRGRHQSGELFVESWFAAAPAEPSSAAAFVGRWREMLDWAFSTASPLAVRRAQLLGIGLRLGGPRLDPAIYQGLVGALLPFYERWTEDGGLDSASEALDLARFLALPASRELVLPGVAWLGGAVKMWRGAAMGDTGQAELFEALVPILRMAWESGRARVRADLALRSAFLDLLGWVVAGGTPGALELEEQVRGMMSAEA